MYLTSNIILSITHTCNRKEWSPKKAIAETSQINLYICVCWVIVVANLMLMFSILVLLIMPYFAVNSADKYYKF